MVSIAVEVVPAAPSVTACGVKEHDVPAGRPAQESERVCPATAALAVNDTVNVADCPGPRVTVCGEAVSVPAFPNPATFNPVPAIAKPKTLPLGVPVLNFDNCFPELISK